MILLEACGYILVSNNFLSLLPALFHRLFDIIQPTTGSNSTAALRQTERIKNIFCVHPFGSKGASSSRHQLIRYSNCVLTPCWPLEIQVSLQCVFPGDTRGGGSRLSVKVSSAGRRSAAPEISVQPHGDGVQYGEPARRSNIRGSRLAAHSQARSAGQHPVKHILSNYSQQPVRVTSTRDGAINRKKNQDQQQMMWCFTIAGRFLAAFGF